MSLFGGVTRHKVPVIANQLRKDHMTDGEHHVHEETTKEEHTNEDGTVKQETTEKTEADTEGDGDE